LLTSGVSKQSQYKLPAPEIYFALNFMAPSHYNEIMKKRFGLYGKKAVLFLTACFLWPLFFSCSRSEPRIAYGFMELAYYPGTEKPEERYSFFIIPEDDDGVENLAELYLYHDREGLRWLITSDDWVKHEEEGKTWVGSRNIARWDGESLPRGQYRAVLVNKGGEKTERNFTFDGPETPPYPFPFFSVSGENYRIDSRYPVNRLILYDQQGKIIQTVMVTEIAGTIRDLKLSNSARTAALWAEDPEYHLSALTEAAAVR
jgi:hypothetical protein